MAILNSCCWWRSVRRGSYASVFYTMFYFGSSCIIAFIFLHDERPYLTGEVDTPGGESFLEKETISAATVIFNILLLFCATCGLIASVLVVVALERDRRELLVPWIIVMCLDIAVEFVHFVFLQISDTLHFEPLTATLYTIDMFIVCLNIYCLLCVMSQYQELRAGRGTARHDQRNAPIGHIMYIPATGHSNHHHPRSAHDPSHRSLTPPSTKTTTPSRTPFPAAAVASAPNGRLLTSAGASANGTVNCVETVLNAAMCTSSSSSRSCAIILEEDHSSDGSLESRCNAAGDSDVKLTEKHVQFPDTADDVGRCRRTMSAEPLQSNCAAYAHLVEHKRHNPNDEQAESSLRLSPMVMGQLAHAFADLAAEDPGTSTLATTIDTKLSTSIDGLIAAADVAASSPAATLLAESASADCHNGRMEPPAYGDGAKWQASTNGVGNTLQKEQKQQQRQNAPQHVSYNII